MRLHLHTDRAETTVSDGADLKRLDAVVHGTGDIAATLGGHGAMDDDGSHLWIDIAWLRIAAGAGQPDTWPAQFDGMVAYATSKGWSNPDHTRLRVHLTPE
jgi:hypothetical protein